MQVRYNISTNLNDSAAVHLFEKIKAPEVCTSNKPSQIAIEYMEKRVRDKGEPYDQQVAEG